MFDFGATAVGPGDGDDVEAGSVAEKPVAFQIGDGQARQAALFFEIDGLGRMARFLGRSGQLRRPVPTGVLEGYV